MDPLPSAIGWGLQQRIDGTLSFPADELYEELAPGDYEARLMFDDHYRVMAVAPFTVAAP